MIFEKILHHTISCVSVTVAVGPSTTFIQQALESASRLSRVSQILDLTCRPSYRCSKWQLKRFSKWLAYVVAFSSIFYRATKCFESSIERVLCPLLLMKRTLIQLVLESDSRLSCVSQVLDLTCRPSYRCSKWQLKSDLHMKGSEPEWANTSWEYASIIIEGNVAGYNTHACAMYVHFYLLWTQT